MRRRRSTPEQKELLLKELRKGTPAPYDCAGKHGISYEFIADLKKTGRLYKCGDGTWMLMSEYENAKGKYDLTLAQMKAINILKGDPRITITISYTINETL